MNNNENPWSKATLLDQLEHHHLAFKAEIKNLNTDHYTYSWENKWTPGQQLRHIHLSVKPLVLALSLPRFVIQWKFGLANRSSRSYKGLVEKYQNALAGMPAAAPKSFHPVPEEYDHREHLFSDYDKALKKLLKQVRNMRDKDLERYVLPHPLIGKLTLREMLYFTIYHVQHHQKIVQEIIRHAKA